MCKKFRKGFELRLRDHFKKNSYKNSGIFANLIRFAAELDFILAINITEFTILRGMMKIIQNNLLNAIVEIYRAELKKEKQMQLINSEF